MATSAMALQVLPVKPATKVSHYFLFSPAPLSSSFKPLQPPRYPSISLCVSTDSPSPSSSSPPSSSSSRSASFASTRLYVSGLSFRTTVESLRTAFEKFGQLTEVNLVMDKIANRPRGFAFLRYATEEESKKAIDGMHGKFLHGRVIFVEVAQPRSSRQTMKKPRNGRSDLRPG